MAEINDKEFKGMNHHFPSIYESIKLDNYRPDVCFAKNNEELIVLELENKIDRKPYIGALLEACVHAEKKGYKLLKIYFIMIEKETQINVDQMVNYAKPYVDWLKKKLEGIILIQVFCISQQDYQRITSDGICILNCEECVEIE